MLMIVLYFQACAKYGGIMEVCNVDVRVLCGHQLPNPTDLNSSR